MRNLQEITELLNISILEEATTKVSFWGTETYGEFFSENLPDLGVLDFTKLNFPIPLLNTLATEPNKVEEKIVEVFEGYSRKGFFAKLWWRITNWSESIEDYRHFYTIIRLTELNKAYTSILQVLETNPDTPKHTLFTAVFDALTLYFSSFLPSHGFFNRLFQEHHQLCHTKIEDQFNYLVESMESGFNYFNNKLVKATENLNDVDNNQLVIQDALNWLEGNQNQLNEIPEEKKNNYDILSNRLSEINLVLTGLIHQLREVSQENCSQQIIIKGISEPTVNSVPVFFQPRTNLKKQMSPENLPKDTQEACALWFKKIMNNPKILEVSLKALRIHTEHLTKDADTDLLRYTLLSQLSVRWVEAIKWQDYNNDLKQIKFSMSTIEAAEDVKANLNTLWKKVFARHYHTDKNAGANEETLNDLKKTTQAFNEEKSLNCQLIDEVISSSVCPAWIEKTSLRDDLNLADQIDKIMKKKVNIEKQLNELREDLHKMNINRKKDLEEFDKRREKRWEESNLRDEKRWEENNLRDEKRWEVTRQERENQEKKLDFFEAVVNQLIKDGVTDFSTIRPEVMKKAVDDMAVEIGILQKQPDLTLETESSSHVNAIGFFRENTSDSASESLMIKKATSGTLNQVEQEFGFSEVSTNISDYKDSSEGLSESDPDDEKSTVHVCNM